MMQALLEHPRAHLIGIVFAVTGFVIFGFAIGVLMSPYSPVMGEDMSRMTCLQVAFTSERVTDIVLSFPPEARIAASRLLFPGDMVFAWGYGFLFSGLIMLLALRLPEPWRRAGAIFMWFPLLASLLDDIEDLFLYNMVTQLIADPGAEIAPLLPLLASTAATIKYVSLCGLAPAYSFAGVGKGVVTDRSPVAWVIYILIAFFAITLVMRPLQQLPACWS